ncbi:MAG: polysaccharide biosynthesis tyrosine autokinase [Planctomycetia bacterium]|nr:polysaccharide biosynthesis tyrosine autokinase [Planctomycetia bacterium]
MYEEYVRTEVSNIMAENVLNDALRAIEENPDIQQTMFVGVRAVFELSEELQVAPRRGTQFITVSLTSRNAKETTHLVNAVLQAYIARRKQSKKTAEELQLGGLIKTQTQLQNRIATLSDRLKNFRAADDVPAILEVERSAELARLQFLGRQLLEARIQKTQARAALTQYRKMQEGIEGGEGEPGAEVAVSPLVEEAIRRDPTIVGMENQKSLLNRTLADMQQKYGPNYKAVQSVQAQLKELDNELQRKRAELQKKLQEQQVAMLEQTVALITEQERDLQDRINDATAKVKDLKDQADKYQTIQNEHVSKTELLNTINRGIEEARIASAVSQSIVTIRLASVPWKHSQPILALYIPAVSILGLLFGMVLAFAIEFLDTGIRSPAEVVRSVGLAILGNIPDRTEDDEIPLDADLFLVAEHSPQSLLAEAFRQVRTNILFSTDQPVRRILVTSPNAGDGKTTLATNLAITLAASGTRVLLIEGNLRRAALHRIFDLPNQTGLSNLLAGVAEPADAIQATRVPNLSVVTAGRKPPNPAELLGAQAMNRFIAEQGENFDTVLVDGSPTLLVTDNHALSRMVDGVVLVLRVGASTRGIAQRAATQLITLKAKLLGVVLNGVHATRGGYFRESYRAYYDYLGSAQQTTGGNAPLVGIAGSGEQADKSADDA